MLHAYILHPDLGPRMKGFASDEPRAKESIIVLFLVAELV
jgi:hypothetical protein